MPNYQGAFWFNYVKGNIDHNVAVPGGSDVTTRFVEVRSRFRLLCVHIELRLHPVRIAACSSCLTAKHSRAGLEFMEAEGQSASRPRTWGIPELE